MRGRVRSVERRRSAGSERGPKGGQRGARGRGQGGPWDGSPLPRRRQGEMSGKMKRKAGEPLPSSLIAATHSKGSVRLPSAQVNDPSAGSNSAARSGDAPRGRRCLPPTPALIPLPAVRGGRHSAMPTTTTMKSSDAGASRRRRAAAAPGAIASSVRPARLDRSPAANLAPSPRRGQDFVWGASALAARWPAFQTHPPRRAVNEGGRGRCGSVGKFFWTHTMT